MSKARLAFTVKKGDSFCDVWVLRQNIDTGDCKLQAEEVSAVKWVSSDEIRRMAAQGTFWAYRYLDDLSSF